MNSKIKGNMWEQMTLIKRRGSRPVF